MIKNLVIIGFGGMGSYHYRQLKNFDFINVIGAYDIDEKAKENIKRAGIINYSSIENILRDEKVDIALISTPNDSHEEIAFKLLNNKIHVICEKPCAMNLQQVKNIIRCAEDNNVIFTVNQNRRFDFDYLSVKKILNEKKVGRPFRIESKVHGSRGIPGDWRGMKKHGGGMVFDWGIHLIDQVLLLENFNIISLYATFTHVTNKEVDDGFTIEFLCEDNTTILVEVITCSFEKTDRWKIFGSEGTTVIKPWVEEGTHTVLKSWVEKDTSPIVAGNGLSKTMAPRLENESTVEINVEFEKNEPFIIYENFVNAINGNEELVISHESLIRTFEVIEKVFESVEYNKIIKI